MKRITIELNEKDHARLVALARAKNATPEACLIRMVQSCQPNGSGWVHPADKPKS